MTERVFVDTNIFVYAFVTDGSDKHIRAKTFLEKQGDSIAISTQVLNELYVVLLKYDCSDAQIQKYLKGLSADVEVIPVTYNVVSSAWHIRMKSGFSIWDSLIVAAALEVDCSILCTEDLQHGQYFDDRLRIMNPFMGDEFV